MTKRLIFSIGTLSFCAEYIVTSFDVIHQTLRVLIPSKTKAADFKMRPANRRTCGKETRI